MSAVLIQSIEVGEEAVNDLNNYINIKTGEICFKRVAPSDAVAVVAMAGLDGADPMPEPVAIPTTPSAECVEEGKLDYYWFKIRGVCPKPDPERKTWNLEDDFIDFDDGFFYIPQWAYNEALECTFPTDASKEFLDRNGRDKIDPQPLDYFTDGEKRFIDDATAEELKRDPATQRRFDLKGGKFRYFFPTEMLMDASESSPVVEAPTDDFKKKILELGGQIARNTAIAAGKAKAAIRNGKDARKKQLDETKKQRDRDKADMNKFVNAVKGKIDKGASARNAAQLVAERADCRFSAEALRKAIPKGYSRRNRRKTENAEK